MADRSTASLDLTEVRSSALLVPHPEISDELLCLAAIYPDLSVRRIDDRSLELELGTCLNHDDDDAHEGAKRTARRTPFELVLSIPLQSYPEIEPPRIQLSSVYLGPFLIPPELHHQIHHCLHQPEPSLPEPVTRRSEFSSATQGKDLIQVDWTPGQVVLFDAVQIITDQCSAWYRERVKEMNEAKHDATAAADSAREVGGKYENALALEDGISEAVGHLALDEEGVSWESSFKKKERSAAASEGIKIWSSDPLVDRKSVFVGHAARVHSQAEVDQVMSELLSDKKIAKASHNITAFRYHDSETHALYHDVDDDGETAAGGRLGHLLSLLQVENILVVVTRWYGGIHLGADRFKLINQASGIGFAIGNKKKSGKK
ncbi:BZ3500_MvSof-1268-A1-R1_Chr5-2g07947 [Microbotryum saponariae]|uniref:BZ3500_MvSof-1268-A1-R1_Chr5-2g07947 protein n=1 Tax=Microbotryum saponariae TaxID=289078 RepID=A0A2X0NJ68_9BASI|nr:BZ3500_MvSof-1268-A1-R1_Chr5-2g07947 [Microbotryum saponariae]SDA05816.1 BZ3501_MvSof-1269-A2-R1_Chr5-2g07769 [Microbotryum saponariae]